MRAFEQPKLGLQSGLEFLQGILEIWPGPSFLEPLKILITVFKKFKPAKINLLMIFFSIISTEYIFV